MKFPRALKITKASARVSAIFLRLANVCRTIEADSGRLATEARSLYCLSHAPVEMAHHIPGRLNEVDSLLMKLDGAELMATDPGTQSRHLVYMAKDEVLSCRFDLRALVDEVKRTLDNAPIEPVQVPAPPKPVAATTPVPTPAVPVAALKPHLPLAGKKPVDASVKAVQVKPYSENKVPYRPQQQGRFKPRVEPEIVTMVRGGPRRTDDSTKKDQ